MTTTKAPPTSSRTAVECWRMLWRAMTGRGPCAGTGSRSAPDAGPSLTGHRSACGPARGFGLRSPDLVAQGEVAAPGGPGQHAGLDVETKQSIVRVRCRHAERFVLSDELLFEGAPR